MHKIAAFLTDYVMIYGNADAKERSIYEYGFQTALETILSFFLCAMLALRMDMFREGIFFFLLFIPMRSYAGGMHFEKYILCLFFSCMTFGGILFLSKRILLPRLFYLVIPALLLIIRLLYPVEHRNRPTDCLEYAFFKKRLVVFLVLDLLIYLVLLVIRNRNFLNIMLLTLLLLVVTMIVGKISYIRYIGQQTKF